MTEEFSVEKIKGSIVSNLRRSVVLKNYEVPEDASSFLSDKNCAVCQAEFGKIGIVHAKKCMCKFCNRGVCPKCSPEKLMHPVSKKEERVCAGCLNKMMESHMSSGYNLKIKDLQEEKSQRKQELEMMIREKQLDMSSNQYLEDQIKHQTSLFTHSFKSKKEDLSVLRDQQELKRMEYGGIKEKYQKYFGDDEKRSSLLVSLQGQIAELKVIWEFNKKVLPELRNQLGELQETGIIVNEKIKEKKGNAIFLGFSDKEQKINGELDECWRRNHVLNEENSLMSQEIVELKKSIDELDEKILVEEIQARNRINDSLISTSSSKYSVEEEQRIQELREKSKENQKKIQGLRMTLENNKVSSRKSKIETEPKAADPGSRPCANCLVY